MVVGGFADKAARCDTPRGCGGCSLDETSMGRMMFWDDLMRRRRRENRLMGGRLLRGAAGNVAVLPEPHPQRRRRWLLPLAVVLLGVALYTTAVRQPAQPPVSTAVPAATLPANP